MLPSIWMRCLRHTTRKLQHVRRISQPTSSNRRESRRRKHGRFSTACTRTARMLVSDGASTQNSASSWSRPRKRSCAPSSRGCLWRSTRTASNPRSQSTSASIATVSRGAAVDRKQSSQSRCPPSGRMRPSTARQVGAAKAACHPGTPCARKAWALTTVDLPRRDPRGGRTAQLMNGFSEIMLIEGPGKHTERMPWRTGGSTHSSPTSR
mmetsp:Transcript_72824/g.170859  ORF Transcript_72824/g.170859 Transcript_72824/m.170859 type:complete len:209 (+) Transcript_72824:870-1496(+)